MKKKQKRGSEKLGQEGMGRGNMGEDRRARKGKEEKAGLKGHREVKRKQSSNESLHRLHLLETQRKCHRGSRATLPGDLHGDRSPSTDEGARETKSILLQQGDCIALKEALAQLLP